MFKRKIYNKLLYWKNTYNGSYACLIEGARRVGKSTVAETFASNEYKSYIKIDFSEVTEEILDVFKDVANHDLFFARLQLETGIDLYERQSCIIFDEVQLFPRARQAIKHLVADGRYDYIETGSLISIKKNVKDILIPSEEHKIQMYPMDYEEFCWAVGENYNLLKPLLEKDVSMGEKTNRTLMRKYRLYLAVGGMPQAVEAYVQGKNFTLIDSIKREIIDLYKDDLMKIDPSGYTSALFESVPSQLALKKKRFVISQATGKRTTEKDRERLCDLLNSKIVIPCYHVAKPAVSLSQTKELDHLKLYLADVGLFSTMLFNSADKTNEDIYKKLLSDKLSLDAGYLYENAIAQTINSCDRPLFYHTWRKPESTHSYEIDFLLNDGNKVSPIEVKSSSVKMHKSLDAFAEKYSSIVGKQYIFSSKDSGKEGAIFLKPMYMAGLMIEQM